MIRSQAHLGKASWFNKPVWPSYLQRVHWICFRPEEQKRRVLWASWCLSRLMRYISEAKAFPQTSGLRWKEICRFSETLEKPCWGWHQSASNICAIQVKCDWLPEGWMCPNRSRLSLPLPYRSWVRATNHYIIERWSPCWLQCVHLSWSIWPYGSTPHHIRENNRLDIFHCLIVL